MKQSIFVFILLFNFILFTSYINAEEYKVGTGDILELRILKPDELTDRLVVSPSGEVSIAYIGSMQVVGKTITQIQQEIQYRLSHGYLKYVVVTVSLVESRSRNFTISGEIVRPGTYPLGDKTTVLTAISIAGGFTRFGSKSQVKVLRTRQDRPGYTKIVIDIGKVMDGDSRADIIIQPGDIIVVSEEGLFK